MSGAAEGPVCHRLLFYEGADDYVERRAVKRWHVREWTTGVGDGAAAPTRPEDAG